MKIIIETTCSPYTGERVGGAETSLRLIAEKLAEIGHEVVLFTKSQHKKNIGFNIIKVNKVKVITFYKFNNSIFNKYYFKNKFKYFRNQLKSFYIKKADIVHFHYNLPLFEFYHPLKEKHNFKVVIRVAGLKPYEDIKAKPEFIDRYQKMFYDSDLLNFISKGLLKLYNQKIKTEKKHININNNYFIKDIGFRDVNQFKNKYNFRKKTEPFKLVMASRFSSYQKRQDLLIDTMQLVETENIHLTLIGSGPMEGKLQEKIHAKKLENRITIIPFLNQHELWGYLQGFNLLVHACDYEGLSKIIIESMGYGLPVLASNVLPLNDYIEDDKNGFLVDNNPQSWASKIKLLSKRKNLNQISFNSKKFIENEYEANKNVVDYEKQFENLIFSSSKRISSHTAKII